MQNVPKKKHAARRHSRILLLIFAVVLVAAAACLLIFARTPAPAPEASAHEDEEITLWAVESADITRIRIAVRNADAWSAVQTESGVLVLEGENSFTVDADIAATLLSGLKSVTAEVLSDDWNGTDEEWAACCHGTRTAEELPGLLPAHDPRELHLQPAPQGDELHDAARDRKSTRLNSSHRT